MLGLNKESTVSVIEDLLIRKKKSFVLVLEKAELYAYNVCKKICMRREASKPDLIFNYLQ